ncbi:MAG: hypothetical protein QXR96_00840 [Candidatus Woesearchaeota archaeon]
MKKNNINTLNDTINKEDLKKITIEKESFENLRMEIEKIDSAREEIIIKSRPIIKESKQAIYLLHKNNLNEAKKSLELANKGLLELKNLIKENPGVDIGSYNNALQEYTEAITYYYFISESRLIKNNEINVDAENYLLGLCDLTGELARRAVFSVVDEHYEEVKKIYEFVLFIHNEFLDFELRNGEIRRKSDSIKWNLKKIEEILYDLKIREKI